MLQEYIDKIVSQYPINTFSETVQNELREVLEAVYEEGKNDPALKAKYINDGYQSALREVKARVGSVDTYTPIEGEIRDIYFSEGHNECLEEIKSLINEI